MAYQLNPLILIVILFSLLSNRCWSENLVQHQFDSGILGKSMDLLVLTPPAMDHSRAYPVLYLFHGQTEAPIMFKNLGWFRKAEKMMMQADIEPMILVAVDIDNSFGVNTQESARIQLPNGAYLNYDGGQYEDYILQEVIPYIDNNYPTLPQQRGRFLGGISMGGFAALHLAFRHPNLFSRVGGHSPALVTDKGFEWLYPNDAVWQQRNPLQLAKTVDLSGLEIYLDIGLQDEWGFVPATRELADILGTKGWSVHYLPQDGYHRYTYWSSRLTDYLEFYGRP